MAIASHKLDQKHDKADRADNERSLVVACTGAEHANLATVTALHVAYYNFCRVHGSLRTSPVMATGIAGHVWELSELLAEI